MTTLYRRLQFDNKAAWEAVRTDYEGVEVVYDGSRIFDETVQPEWEVNIICHGVEIPSELVPFLIETTDPKIRFAGVEE